MAQIKKDGKSYDSGDVTIVMLGNSPNEVSEITYGTDQEHQLNFYLGSNNAQSFSMGKITPRGSITMSMKEVVAIEDAARASGGSTDIKRIKPFDIMVTYANEYNKIVTDKVTAKFQSDGRAVNGEMGISQQFELFVLSVEYNIL
jgi:hypothetical protein